MDIYCAELCLHTVFFHEMDINSFISSRLMRLTPSRQLMSFWKLPLCTVKNQRPKQLYLKLSVIKICHFCCIQCSLSLLNAVIPGHLNIDKYYLYNMYPCLLYSNVLHHCVLPQTPCWRSSSQLQLFSRTASSPRYWSWWDSWKYVAATINQTLNVAKVHNCLCSSNGQEQVQRFAAILQVWALRKANRLQQLNTS